MGYALGIDLGISTTAAAVGGAGRASMVRLGSTSVVVPSVVYAQDDSTVLIGELAEQRAEADPDRVVREFKSWIGDDEPLDLGANQFLADELIVEMVAWVHDTVVEREGQLPDSIVLTHPAWWNEYQLGVLRESLELADFGSVQLLAEAQAAALTYATTKQLPNGGAVAIYDLGGTFNAAALRRRGGSLELLGRPAGNADLGGSAIDELILDLVGDMIAGRMDPYFDPTDPTTALELVRLREACIRAKEQLSSLREVHIPVKLNTLRTDVLLTRERLDHLIGPMVDQTVDGLLETIRSADLEQEDLAAVAVIGACSAIPLVATRLRQALRIPIVTDIHRKHSIALGAAATAARAEAIARRSTQGPVPSVVPASAPPTPSAQSSFGRNPARVVADFDRAVSAGGTVAEFSPETTRKWLVPTPPLPKPRSEPRSDEIVVARNAGPASEMLPAPAASDAESDGASKRPTVDWSGRSEPTPRGASATTAPNRLGSHSQTRPESNAPLGPEPTDRASRVRQRFDATETRSQPAIPQAPLPHRRPRPDVAARVDPQSGAPNGSIRPVAPIDLGGADATIPGRAPTLPGSGSTGLDQNQKPAFRQLPTEQPPQPFLPVERPSARAGPSQASPPARRTRELAGEPSPAKFAPRVVRRENTDGSASLSGIGAATAKRQNLDLASLLPMSERRPRPSPTPPPPVQEAPRPETVGDSEDVWVEDDTNLGRWRAMLMIGALLLILGLVYGIFQAIADGRPVAAAGPPTTLQPNSEQVAKLPDDLRAFLVGRPGMIVDSWHRFNDVEAQRIAVAGDQSAETCAAALDNLRRQFGPPDPELPIDLRKMIEQFPDPQLATAIADEVRERKQAWSSCSQGDNDAAEQADTRSEDARNTYNDRIKALGG